MKKLTEEKLSKLVFRASSMGDIMSGVAKGWTVENSLTCKRKLVQIYRELSWQRSVNFENKYTTKGNEQEESSITLYCRFKKKMFKKNEVRLKNDWFTGELDLFAGEEINKAIHVIDIKTSWDWTTFPSILDTINADYDYQGQVYMDLTGATKHTVAYCLVNTPAQLIVDEKRRLAWKMGIIDNETPEYIEKCIEIEKNCIVDMPLFLKENIGFEFHCTNWDYDIPMHQRVYEIDVLRDEAKIQRMKERVDECRKWMIENLLK